MSAINSGAYFCPGTIVTVVDGHNQPWVGQILNMGLFDASPVLVAVTDPLENPCRWRGQRIVVSWRHLRHTFRSRWSR